MAAEEEIGTTLVADSGAFIKHAPLEKWSTSVVTVKEVLAELRDEHTRRKLLILPCDVTTREPSPSSLQYVTSFAKKTGDYGSLSPVDLKVMALTHQLLCEQDPEKVSQLKPVPVKEVPTVERVNLPGMVGFYKRDISGNSKGDQTEQRDEIHGSVEDGNREGIPEEAVTTSGDEGSDGEVKEIIEEEIGEGGRHVTMATDVGSHSNGVIDDDDGGDDDDDDEDGWITPDNLAQAHEEMGGVTEEEARGLAVACVTTDFAMQSYNLSTKEKEIIEEEIGEDGRHVTMATNIGSHGNGVIDDDGGDDEDGWITPDNLAQAHDEMGGVTEEEARGLAVACITTDFAMQNVLLQMGIPVLSVDGMRIKQLRTYAKKCKACFKTTTNTSLVFCSGCGNKTLAKVSVTVDQDGALHYHFLGQKQFSHKGLRFSLPQPKGGRHANNPVLAPDQKVTQKQRRSRNAAGLNPLHPDYIAQTSPFSMKDVTSRGAQISFQAGRPRLGGGRRNPNTVGPKRK